jgi:hypothetical protein
MHRSQANTLRLALLTLLGAASTLNPYRDRPIGYTLAPLPCFDQPAMTYAEVTKPGYALRRIWFWIVLFAATGAFAASLLALPYPGNAGAPMPWLS